MIRSIKIASIGALIFFTGLVLSSCNLPVPNGGTIEDWLKRITPTSPAILASETSQPFSGTEEPCSFMWATRPLPEVTEALQKYFTDASIMNAGVTAEAYGENCVLADGSVARFLTMYTDVRVRVQVARLDDTRALAEQTETILRLVLDYPQELLPGSSEGYLGITFTDPQAQVENLWFRRLDGKKALDQGMTGEELLLYLRGS